MYIIRQNRLVTAITSSLLTVIQLTAKQPQQQTTGKTQQRRHPILSHEHIRTLFASGACIHAITSHKKGDHTILWVFKLYMFGFSKLGDS